MYLNRSSSRKLVVGIGLALSCLCLVGAAATTKVPSEEIDAVNIRWQSFGVTLPAGGLILEEPFKPPYSRRSFVVPPSWFFDVAKAYRDNPNFTVSAPAMRADLPTLNLIVEKVYAA